MATLAGVLARGVDTHEATYIASNYIERKGLSSDMDWTDG